jgi:hypothetical protein
MSPEASRMPQWPWEVYSQRQTSQAMRREGKRALSFWMARMTGVVGESAAEPRGSCNGVKWGSRERRKGRERMAGRGRGRRKPNKLERKGRQRRSRKRAYLFELHRDTEEDDGLEALLDERANEL